MEDKLREKEFIESLRKCFDEVEEPFFYGNYSDYKRDEEYKGQFVSRSITVHDIKANIGAEEYINYFVQDFGGPEEKVLFRDTRDRREIKRGLEHGLKKKISLIQSKFT